MTPEETQAYEIHRDRLISQAVNAADILIVEGCRGNPEVLMLLTAAVAAAFMEKAMMMMRAEVWKKEMLCEVPPEVLAVWRRDGL
jgi:hypothetical protein